MTTDHAAALDGAVLNLIDNRLTVPQILELADIYRASQPCYREGAKQPQDYRADLERALLANVRPRP